MLNEYRHGIGLSRACHNQTQCASHHDNPAVKDRPAGDEALGGQTCRFFYNVFANHSAFFFPAQNENRILL
jgi:hypothetical protein